MRPAVPSTVEVFTPRWRLVIDFVGALVVTGIFVTLAYFIFTNPAHSPSWIGVGGLAFFDVIAFAVLLERSYHLILNRPALRADQDGIRLRGPFGSAQYARWADVWRIRQTHEAYGGSKGRWMAHLRIECRSGGGRSMVIAQRFLNRSIEDVVTELLERTPAGLIEDVQREPAVPGESTRQLWIVLAIVLVGTLAVAYALLSLYRR